MKKEVTITRDKDPRSLDSVFDAAKCIIHILKKREILHADSDTDTLEVDVANVLKGLVHSTKATEWYMLNMRVLDRLKVPGGEKEVDAFVKERREFHQAAKLNWFNRETENIKLKKYYGEDPKKQDTETVDRFYKCFEDLRESK